jgi:hypothetical protein
MTASSEDELGDTAIGSSVRKRFRRYLDVEFNDKLLVSCMIVVKAWGRKDLPFVFWYLITEWHDQIKDEDQHPRHKGFKLFTAEQSNCCFKNWAEWGQCDLMSKGRGKPKDATDSVPSMSAHCLAWAEKKFNKWLEIVREMQNFVNPEYVRPTCATLFHDY